MSGHTPGEWYLNAGNETEVQAGTKQVARAHCGGMTGVRLIEAEANARLITTAPDGLALAQAILADCTDTTPKEWIDMASALVAKAEGR